MASNKIINRTTGAEVTPQFSSADFLYTNATEEPGTWEQGTWEHSGTIYGPDDTGAVFFV